jgi:N,N'-diacetyllegionaminate synthase
MIKKNKILVIAEAGVNHNGSLSKAFKMVDIAAKAGADFIKFQTFDPESLANVNLGLANYQKKFSKQNDHLKMLKKFTLSEKSFKKILLRCKKKKINFLSSPFDIKSINILKKLKISEFKIPSGQIDDVPYLEHIGSLKKKIFLSTGMSNLSDIKKALKVLIKNGTPKKNIIILHCISQYPALDKNLNLNSISFIKDKLKFPVGFSDHSIGFDASLISIGLGARIIEKHFTLNKNQLGPDHKSSLNPDELFEFIKKIRKAEKSLGQYSKEAQRDELVNLNYIRKKIVARREIFPGDIFSSENLITKRSASGLPASLWKKILGKKSKKIYKLNQGIVI